MKLVVVMPEDSFDRKRKKDCGDLMITHNGKSLHFGVFTAPNSWDHDPAELFVEINMFWASQSAARQEEIFQAYQSIENLFNTESNSNKICLALQQLVIPILDKFHHTDLISEFANKIEIEYPSNAEEEFNSNDARKHREMTYLRHEYFGLVVIAIILRTMLPVWNLFRESLEGDASKKASAYIDLEILRTLKYTDFGVCHQMVRLNSYTTATYKCQDSSGELSSVVSGLGTTAIPDYIFASVLANKLITTPLVPSKAGTSLISAIFNKVKQDCNHLGEKFPQRVRHRLDNRMGDEDDKIGYFESYAVRQDASNDVYLLSQVYLYDYRKARADLDPTIPPKLVMDCLRSFNTVNFNKRVPIMGGNNMLPVHQTIVQWVMSPIVHPRTIPFIDRKAMINAMAISQAALIHWGLRGLARTLSYMLEQSDEDDMITPMLPVETDLKAKIEKAYPYWRKEKNKDSAKNMYPALISIEEYCLFLIGRKWSIVASDEVKEALNYKDGDRVIDMRIKSEIAQLFIMHQSRNDNK